MTDLLAAASLLTAAVTVLYGLWYPEIVRTLELPLPSKTADFGPVRRQVRLTFRARILPLAALAVCVALVFVPDAIAIAREAIALIVHNGMANVRYDSQKTAVCLVVVFSIGMACHVSALALKTWRLLMRLSPRQ